MENNSSTIGQRIYDLRIEHDVQQGELSKAIGMHQSVLNRIEKGSRPARDAEIVSISRYFNVCTDYLLGLTQHKEREASESTLAPVTPLPQHRNLDDVETELINKFRVLDERGQAAVVDTATREYNYAFPKGAAASS